MSNNSDQPPFSPVYSTIKTVYLETRDRSVSLNISQLNEECQFERLELSESIQSIFPEGVLLVRDIKDIASYIKIKNIEIVRFDNQNGTYSDYDITSVSYLNNTASETEENFVGIYFSNKYYKSMQSSSLVHYLSYKPLVWKINDFVKNIAKDVFKAALNEQDYIVATKNVDKNIDKTKNYVLYKPYNPSENRIEQPSDNAIQYLSYLSSMACGGTADTSCEPRFLFWTNWNNEVNFKYFEKKIDDDKNASDSIIQSNYLRFAIVNADVPLVKLKKKVIEDGEEKTKEIDYRKIYTLTSDPVDQFISKNYYYIRKVPKFLDNTPAGLTKGSSAYINYTTDSLTYLYQDEGQKFNIEMIGSTGGLTFSGFTSGADEIECIPHWGYYNQLFQLNGKSNLTFLGENFGTEKVYSDMNLAGDTGYMPYVDNAQMWKNMFDITEIHPHYPTYDNLTFAGITAAETNLQQVIDVRYKIFKKYLDNYNDITLKETERLELMRKIEKQNFIMYVLCCMAKQEESFFALLTRYETDTTYPTGSTRVPYRYNWVKLNFNSPYGLSGPTGSCGGISGGTYWMHQVEKWSKDPIIKGNCFQDDTWAINLNEHGLTGGYIPPGWVSEPPTGFKWRPIGISTVDFSSSGNIHHIVKMNVVPMTDLLLDSNQLVPENYIGKYLYYFTVENVVDGSC
jgi:hypothetical protein